MDKLEDFIRKNRSDFDFREPSPWVWKGIRAQIGNRRRSILWWSAAASVIVLLGISALFLYPWPGRGNVSRREEIIMKRNPQLMETEFYYNNLVKTLSNEAKPLLVGYPDLRKELNSDMSRIDSLCAEIKKDLRDNVSNQQVIEALINNYRIKTEILQEMLEMLKQEQNSQEKPKSHEI
jgi:hypothetical protein